MSKSMLIRTLYLEGGVNEFDLEKGIEVAGLLSETATDEKLFEIRDDYYILQDTEDEDPANIRIALRTEITRWLVNLKESLDDENTYDVAWTYDQDSDIWMFQTGGVSGGDDPTKSYAIWDIVSENNYLLPDDWAVILRDACGFINPSRIRFIIKEEGE